MHPPINISRSTVIGCEAKYELTKKGLKEDFCVLKKRFLVKKRVIQSSREAKERQNRVDDFKNRSSEVLVVKNGICHLKFGVPRNFSQSPKTRRHVSAHVINFNLLQLNELCTDKD